MYQPSPEKPQSQTTLPQEELQSAPPWAKGDAKLEYKKWSHLEDVKLNNDKWWFTCYGWLLVSITIAFGLSFLIAFGIWTWHHLTPHCPDLSAPGCWQWLDEQQLGKIQSVLFSGGMGAIISGVIRGQMKKAE